MRALSAVVAALLCGACSGDAAEPASPFPATLTERGFVQHRSIIHLHSAFSHDACDGDGLDADGAPNWPCIRRMKAALCAENISVAFMTDHPSFMRDQTFEDLLYTEAGDTTLSDAGGAVWGARYACPEGGGGPDGTVVLIPGYEGSPHTMPIGLRRHLDPVDLYSVGTKSDTDPARLDAMTAGVRAAGGMVTIAHSEEDDLDVAVLADHDISGMELYNFHANFNRVLSGGNLLMALFGLDAFLAPDGPDPDLAALLMLGQYPEAALDKWRQVSWRRHITAFAGSDVHENAELPALCEQDVVCAGFADDNPNLVEFLKTGGPMWFADGDRLDGYARIFRWVQNRVWVAPDGAAPEGVEAAFEAGRNVVVFEVLGDATGTAFIATTGEGDDKVLHDMGATLTVADGATLWVRSPELPTPGRRAAWTDGSAGLLEATVYRTNGSGTVAVQTWTEPGTWVSLPLDQPGSYQLEVMLTPHHLSAALGPAAHFAEAPYRWVETNAIRVE